MEFSVDVMDSWINRLFCVYVSVFIFVRKTPNLRKRKPYASTAMSTPSPAPLRCLPFRPLMTFLDWSSAGDNVVTAETDLAGQGRKERGLDNSGDSRARKKRERSVELLALSE